MVRCPFAAVALLALALFIQPAPAGAADKAFEKSLGHLKETLQLEAPAYNKEKHQPTVKAFFTELVAAVADRSLAPEESFRLAAAYAQTLDLLKIRKRRKADDELRSILLKIPVPEPKVEQFFRETDTCLADAKARRDREVTPEGLLTQYGDGKSLERTQDLFEHERSSGYALKAKSGDVEKMLGKYYPDRPAKTKSPAGTDETALSGPRLVDDLFDAEPPAGAAVQENPKK